MAEKRGKILKFIWKIENFSYCWNETNDFLKSPDFHLDIFEGSAWGLKLYSRGRPSYENYVSVYLERLSSSKGPLGITIDYEIALLRKNGATKYVKEMKDRCFRKGYSYGFDNLVTREKIFGSKRSTLLPDDILTLECCIFPKNTELETYTEVIAKTHIEIQRFRRQWKEIDYSPNFLSGKFCGSKNLKAFHCKIGVLDSNNSVAKFLVNKSFDITSADRKRDSCVYLPIVTEAEILKNKSVYLPNGKLNLDCEFTLCDGLQHSQIEGIARETTFNLVPVDETASTYQLDLPPKKFLYCIDNIPSSLKNDFQNLYQEGTLSDFTIKVGNKNLEVHKAVLCARSPVFKAMLTSNMKENVKNMVDISDLDVDTVYRMLIFMYTDKAGNLDWETSNKLYFVADKYGLITLKHICSEVLKQNLSVTNLREVL
ncbi:Speckle-type POZ protein-like B, partial [Araneus ventricosus]